MITKSDPKVVACIPAYNAEPFISGTLQSLKDQSYPNFQVLISDDYSTDNTTGVIMRSVQDEDRFTLIEQKKNIGWIDNVNFLMKKAVEMGEYVCIVPHDDQLDPDYITKLALALERNPQAVLAFCDIRNSNFQNRNTTDNGNTVLTYEEVEGIKDGRERTKKIIDREGDWWIAYRGVTRSEAVKKIIPLRKNIFGSNEFVLDWIWLIRLSIQASAESASSTISSETS